MYLTGTSTYTSTGNKTISGIPFEPKYVRFNIGEQTTSIGATNTQARTGYGFTDGTNQSSFATLANSSGYWTRTRTDKCIEALTYVSGAINRSLSGSFVSFNNDGGGSYSVTINLDQCDVSWPIHFEIFG